MTACAARWRHGGHVDKLETRIKQGMAKKGYDPEFADAIFKQICGFGGYGFPESHAYSFVLLAYVSLWMKCHQPAILLTALINSPPLGFYAPSQLVPDAKRHGVEVRAVDVCASDWTARSSAEPMAANSRWCAWVCVWSARCRRPPPSG